MNCPRCSIFLHKRRNWHCKCGLTYISDEVYLLLIGMYNVFFDSPYNQMRIRNPNNFDLLLEINRIDYSITEQYISKMLVLK